MAVKIKKEKRKEDSMSILTIIYKSLICFPFLGEKESPLPFPITP
jgi:hypothetical protein